MEKVFLWTGFICLMLIALTLTFFIVVAAFDVIIKQTKFLDKISKRFAKWHKSFPKRDQHHRYALAVYDYEEGKFLHSRWLDENMLTDEERERQFAEWRKQHTRRKEEAH